VSWVTFINAGRKLKSIKLKVTENNGNYTTALNIKKREGTLTSPSFNMLNVWAACKILLPDKMYDEQLSKALHNHGVGYMIHIFSLLKM
jgi:hypothetical protein